jgi:hypothetical protein
MALVGIGSNNSQYAPDTFFLKLFNIEQQFILSRQTIGWKHKKLPDGWIGKSLHECDA